MGILYWYRLAAIARSFCWSGHWSATEVQVGGSTTCSVAVVGGVGMLSARSGSILYTFVLADCCPSSRTTIWALDCRLARWRGLATRSVISMITEPWSGPEHASPSRRHCWQKPAVSSHCAGHDQHAGGETGSERWRTLTLRSRHCWQARERCALGISDVCAPSDTGQVQ